MMRQIVEFLANNWSIIIAVIAILVVAGVAVYKFLQLPTNAQIEKVKKCLLAWVISAEADLGGGTGKVKLSVVYGYFVTAFPILKNFVSFETFSRWVDEALDIMREMLKENTNLKQVVEGTVLTVGEAVTPLQEFPSETQ